MLLSVRITIEIENMRVGSGEYKYDLVGTTDSYQVKLGGGGKEFPFSSVIYSGILFPLITFAAAPRIHRQTPSNYPYISPFIHSSVPNTQGSLPTLLPPFHLSLHLHPQPLLDFLLLLFQDINLVNKPRDPHP